MKPRTYVAAAIATCSMAVFTHGAFAADNSRCKMATGEKAESMKKLGIVEVCQPIDPSVGGGDLFEKATKIVIEGITFVMTDGLINARTEGVVMFDRISQAIKFSVPSDPAYKDYVVCGFSQRIISEIPKPGRYLKHGWERYTEKSVNHAWILRDRGGTYSASRFHTDLYFSYLPKANLESARSQNLCLANPAAEAGKRWR